jgi:dTDP-4-dehydrorhamnose 3,5-epimerase
MEVIDTGIPEVKLLQPKVFGDERGHFMEVWNRRVFATVGLDADFVQDNESASTRGVLRGLHYQIRQPQGKLVRVVLGEVFDVAVDLRIGSPHFGHWTGARLSDANRRQLWIPPGFAHGFYVLSERAVFTYKCTDYYLPEAERTIRWDDPALGIEWPVSEGGEPVLSAKDAAAIDLHDAECYP